MIIGIIIIIIAVILAAARIIVSRWRKRKAIKSNEVSKIVCYNLNGQEQNVLIEGEKKNLPILVLLHGGPCFPVPFNEGCCGMFKEITKSYLTVYWDQLGCGKNRKIYNNGKSLPNNISTEDYELMLRDLLKNLRKDYPNHKVYLFGISWGTFLTAKIASKYPELIDKVIVYGQFRGNMFQTQDIFDTINKFCSNEKDKKFLEECKTKEALTDEEIFRVEKLIKKYTDGFIYQGKTGRKQSNSMLYKIIFSYFLSPDYSLRQALGSIIDCSGARKVSIQMIHSDITDSLKNIKVPYKILQGEKDLQTSRYQIEEFQKKYNNPNVSIKIIPDSGHIPTNECFSIVLNEIQKIKEGNIKNE